MLPPSQSNPNCSAMWLCCCVALWQHTSHRSCPQAPSLEGVLEWNQIPSPMGQALKICQGPSGPAFRTCTTGALGTIGHNISQYQNQVHQEGQQNENQVQPKYQYLMICRNLYAHKGSILLNSPGDHGKPRRFFFFGSSLERILYVIPVVLGIVSGRSRMVQKC